MTNVRYETHGVYCQQWWSAAGVGLGKLQHHTPGNSPQPFFNPLLLSLLLFLFFRFRSISISTSRCRSRSKVGTSGNSPQTFFSFPFYIFSGLGPGCLIQVFLCYAVLSHSHSHPIPSQVRFSWVREVGYVGLAWYRYGHQGRYTNC